VIRFKKNGEEGSENIDEENGKKVNKLQKLKDKIKQKKMEKLKVLQEKPDDIIKNNKVKPEKPITKQKEKLLKRRTRENIDVLSKRFEDLREKPETNEEVDDLLVLKKKDKNNEKEDSSIGFSLSNRQLKKIKPEGHFEGRNKIKFDESGY